MTKIEQEDLLKDFRFLFQIFQREQTNGRLSNVMQKTLKGIARNIDEIMFMVREHLRARIKITFMSKCPGYIRDWIKSRGAKSRDREHQHLYHERNKQMGEIRRYLMRIKLKLSPIE